MKTDSFAFLRGAAAIMAAALAPGPTTGLRVQACGDCHLANFGAYATPEEIPVFDVNDFDEPLPAPCWQTANGMARSSGPLSLTQATMHAAFPAFVFFAVCGLATFTFLAPETHERPIAQDADGRPAPARFGRAIDEPFVNARSKADEKPRGSPMGR